MAVVTSDTWQTFSGETYTGAALASLATICEEVSAAIERKCYPWKFEPVTLDDAVLDAPWDTEILSLPLRPCRSVSEILYNPRAYGVVANFDATDDALTEGEDWQLVIDTFPEKWSRAGRVRRVGRSNWGSDQRRHPYRLGWQPADQRGALLVSGAYGFTTVPADVRAAAHLAVSLILERRKKGAPVGNESWNGYSYGLSGPFTATAALDSPDVAQLLVPYTRTHVA